MTNPSSPRIPLILSVILSMLAAMGCGETDARRTEGDAHDHGAQEATVDDHEDHEHGEESDLDRSVAELFADRCEHDISTHQCAECSYEVGIVRVRPELLEEGLVATTLAARHELPGEVTFTGEIRFDDRRIAHLGPRVDGTVLRAAVDIGDRVDIGQTLVEMESTELAEAQAGYLESLAGRDLSRRSFARLSELREAGIASEREYLEVEQNLATAEIQVNSARQRLLQFGLVAEEVAALEAGGIAEAVGRFSLRAPFAGEILGLHAVRGERLGPDDELALLGDVSSLWVWADLYESQIAAVGEALAGGSLPVDVEVNAFPGQRFPGRLDFLDRVMDEGTRTVKSRIVLANPDGLLRPGMFAHIHISLGGAQPRLVIPAEALLADEGREFVFLRHDEEYFLRRPVRGGARFGGLVEILEGLDEGESVVSRGAFLLKSDVLRSKMGAGCAD